MGTCYYSGITALDHLLYEGEGLPAGRLALFYGDEQTGKTALALWYARAVLRDPERVAGWVLTEAEPVPHQLAWAGIPPDQFVINYQTPALPGLEAARLMVEEGCDLVVVDSLAACQGPEPGMSLEAVLGFGLGPLAAAAAQRETLVLLTDQVRTVRGRAQAPAGLCPALLRYVECQLALAARGQLVAAGRAVGQRVGIRLVRDGGDPARWGQEVAARLHWTHGFLPGVRRSEKTFPLLAGNRV